MTSAMTLAAIVGIQQAAAQGLPAAVVSCMDEHDAAKRLACYDREVPRAVAASAGATAPGSSTASAAGASPSAAAATPAVRAPSPQSTTALASSTTRAGASTAAPRPPEPAAGQTSAASAASEVDAFGMTAQLQRKESGATAPPGLNKLTAHIAAVSQKPPGEFIVTLDNGQVWEEAETVSHLPLRTGDSITIKRGMLGSFYMSSEQVLGLRVRRVR
jgi:hypothetical protein